MGPVRGRLTGPALAAVVPGSALAEVCDKVRPMWRPGSPATALDEMLGLMGTPPSLALLVLSALVLRFRHSGGALAVTVLWSLWVSVVVFFGMDEEVQQMAAAEGCIGSPALFVLAVAVLCGAMIVYTNRKPEGPAR